MKKKIKIFLLVMFSWFLIHEIVIIRDGLNDETAKSDVAVIFGTTVNTDGTLSDRLKARVDKGFELYADSIVSKLIVSGGLGIEGHLEGSKMAEYLISKGVPNSDIIIDNEGNNTALTAKNFLNHLSDSSSVIVVSQFFHITRAKLAFRKAGISNVQGVHCDYFGIRDIWSLCREFVGYYKYLLFAG